MVSCVPGLNDELQFSTFRRLGYGGYLRKWEGIFSFLFFFFLFTKRFGCVAGTLTTWNDCGRGAPKSNCIERPFVSDYGVFNREVT